MARLEETDPIGPDPVIWLERLIDVNDGSSFHPEDKVIIQHQLESLRFLMLTRGETRGNQKQSG